MRCLFIILCAGMLAAEGLVKNPMFADADGNGTPDEWGYGPGPDGTSTKVEVVTVEGTRALKFIDDNPKLGLGISQFVPVAAGKTYRERALIAGGRIALYMNWHDKDKKKINPEVMKWFDGGRGLTSCEWDVKAPANAAFCQVWAYTTSTYKGEVIIASLSLEEATAPAGFGADTLAAFGFESDAWSGAERSEKNVKEGKYSARWANLPKNGAVTTDKIPHDWTGYNALSVWVYSEKNTRQEVIVILDSKSDPAKFSYLAEKFTVDWTGWKEVTIPFAVMDKTREPAGFGKIDKITFNANGWGITAHPDTVLYLDAITLKKGEIGPTGKERKVAIPPPARQTLESLVAKKHPRILITDADIARIKNDIRANAAAKKAYDMLKSRAEKTLTEPPSKYEIPDGLRLLTTSRRVLGRTYALGMMYLLDGDERYKTRLFTELDAAAKFKDWNPRHYLDTAELMHAFGIAYDWLYNSWTDNERNIIRTALVNLGLTNSAAAYRGKGPSHWWVNGDNNWNFVCNGGTVVGALAVFDEETDLAVDLITNAFASFQPVMEEFEPDGAWYEGPGYWHYSIKYLVPLIGSIESACGTNFGILDAFAGFCKSGDFPVYTTGPSGYSFNFADAGSGKTGSLPELFWFAKKFRNPLYHAFERTRITGAAEELMYFDASLETVPPSAAALDKHFRKTEVAVLCSSWADSNAIYLGLKAGENGTPHFHYDLGSFVLDSGGQRFIDDLGSEWMTYIAYSHSYKHHEFYRIRPEGHNTIVINPSDEPGQYKKAVSVISGFESIPASAQASVDLSDAYRPKAKKIVRTAALVENRTAAEITDVIETEEPSTIWWFAHTRAAVTIEDGGKKALLTLPNAALRAEIRSPADARFSVMNAAPLPSSPDPTGQNKNTGMRKLALALSNATAATVIVRFTPEKGEPDIVYGIGENFKPVMASAVMIEAEAFSSQKNGTVSIVDKIANSGRSFNMWNDDGHALSWTFSVPADGRYGILVRYACGEDGGIRRAVLIDDAKVKGDDNYLFPPTGGWSSSRDDWKEAFFAGKTGGVSIPLKKGEHTLTLVNVSGGGMNLDWIKIVPLK